MLGLALIEDDTEELIDALDEDERLELILELILGEADTLDEILGLALSEDDTLADLLLETLDEMDGEDEILVETLELIEGDALILALIDGDELILAEGEDDIDEDTLEPSAGFIANPILTQFLVVAQLLLISVEASLATKVETKPRAIY